MSISRKFYRAFIPGVVCSLVTITSALTSYAGDVAHIAAEQPTDHCEPLCWLGIRPGKTVAAEAESTLRANKLIPEDKPLTKLFGYGPISSSEQPGVYGFAKGQPWQHQGFAFSLVISDGVVSEIGVDVNVHVVANATQYLPRDIAYYKRSWAKYSPEFAIQQLGAPSDVFVFTYARGITSTNIPGRWIYTLWMVYEQKGLILEYGGLSRTNKQKRTYEICPTFRNGNADWGGITFYIRSIHPQMKPDETRNWVRHRVGLDDVIEANRPITLRGCW